MINDVYFHHVWSSWFVSVLFFFKDTIGFWVVTLGMLCKCHLVSKTRSLEPHGKHPITVTRNLRPPTHHLKRSSSTPPLLDSSFFFTGFLFGYPESDAFQSNSNNNNNNNNHNNNNNKNKNKNKKNKNKNKNNKNNKNNKRNNRNRSFAFFSMQGCDALRSATPTKRSKPVPQQRRLVQRSWWWRWFKISTG